MYFRRKIDDFLIKWKGEAAHRPLIIKGTRQIGKTESVLHFAMEQYRNVVYIDFAKQHEYSAIVSNGSDVDTVTRNIMLANPLARFEEGETIIVFDELQEYPEVAATLKYFRIDGRYDVIAITSMTSLDYKVNTAGVVRNRTDYEMFSMDFEEFLWAKGYQQEHISKILEHMISAIPFSEMEISVYKAMFENYCQIGGMPEAVKIYVESGDVNKSLEILERINKENQDHMRKHVVDLDLDKLLKVHNSVPQQLAKANKKFQFTLIDKNARAREYEGCIRWLLDAGVVVKSNCLMQPKLPLRGNLAEKKYKLYYPDTGLMVAGLLPEKGEDCLTADKHNKKTNKEELDYRAAVAENIIADSLLKQGLQLCYYKKDNSTLEVDFMAKTRTELIPIEVNPDNRSKALVTMIEDKEYRDIRAGIRFGDYNIDYNNGVYSFPYFCGFMMKGFLKERR